MVQKNIGRIFTSSRLMKLMAVRYSGAFLYRMAIAEYVSPQLVSRGACTFTPLKDCPWYNAALRLPLHAFVVPSSVLRLMVLLHPPPLSFALSSLWPSFILRALCGRSVIL